VAISFFCIFVELKNMNPIQGYHLIKPEDLHWRPSNLMQIPNADFSLASDSHTDAEIKSLLRVRLENLKSGRDKGKTFEEVFGDPL